MGKQRGPWLWAAPSSLRGPQVRESAWGRAGKFLEEFVRCTCKKNKGEWWGGGRGEEGAHSGEYQNGCKRDMLWQLKKKKNKKQTNKQKTKNTEQVPPLPPSQEPQKSHRHQLLPQQSRFPSSFLRRVPECSMANCQPPTAIFQQQTASPSPPQHSSPLPGVCPAFPICRPLSLPQGSLACKVPEPSAAPWE